MIHMDHRLVATLSRQVAALPMPGDSTPGYDYGRMTVPSARRISGQAPL